MYAINIESLSKIYDPGIEAIKGIDLQVQNGDFFALIGPNSAGKSTIISILSSLLSKSSGKITVFGHCLDKHKSDVKACIGLMPQEFNFTLLETVQSILLRQAGYYGVAKKIAKVRCEYYLQKLNLWSKRHYQSRKLSGGEKRRLMLARALMHDPRLLIIDEPTANADLETRRQIWDLLRSLNQNGKTILMTTHHLNEAESLCNHVAIINKGSIILNEPIGKLLKRNKKEKLLFFLDKPIIYSPILSSCQCRLLNSTTLEVSINKGQSLNEVFKEFSNQNVVIIGIKSKSNQLEELFLELTCEHT